MKREPRLFFKEMLERVRHARGRKESGGLLRHANLSRAGFQAGLKNFFVVHHAPMIALPNVERRGRHLALKLGSHAFAAADREFGIGMKTTDKQIVVNRYLRVPSIHELSEVRKRETLQAQARLPMLSILFRGDNDLSFIQTRRRARTIVPHTRGEVFIADIETNARIFLREEQCFRRKLRHLALDLARDILRERQPRRS